eukprot:3289405-Pleurochrysis_carterae.AAC.2
MVLVYRVDERRKPPTTAVSRVLIFWRQNLDFRASQHFIRAWMGCMRSLRVYTAGAVCPRGCAQERAEAAEAEVVQKMQLVSQLVEAEEVKHSRRSPRADAELIYGDVWPRLASSFALARAFEARGRQLHLQSQLSALGDETTARIAQLEAAAAALSSELEAEREGRRADARTLAHARAETVALERATREREEAAQRDASLSSKDNEYIRTLVMRYIEREADHAALFPPIAAYFKFTRDEVARIRDAQQAHADANSFWGRTISAGSFLVEVATEAAKEVQRHRDQNHSAGAVSGGSGRPRVP